MGRVGKYRSAVELSKACEDYFVTCDNNTKEVVKVIKDKATVTIVKDPIPYTVPDLASHIGFASKQSVYDLKEKKLFSFVMKKALTRIEGQWIRNAIQARYNPTMIMFLLKAGYGYKEYSGIEISGPGGGAIQLTGVPHKQLSLDEFRALAKSVYEKDFGKQARIKHSKPYLEERSTIVDPVLDVADTNTIARDTDIQD